ncbi:hypothetical protein OG746_20325 [Streptomyces sp. NBC_01016]|uniref:hypothetical protein n=1 Tax=Streptomyces sp. NBC_01016 TaxID=2903720 RepID=UPI0022503395|nr:hypothetical protein [Streptomyces sp. NBC_01016]MCX4831083.1 hypothetical protein [Streptomyces sp. NBC_01016]
MRIGAVRSGRRSAGVALSVIGLVAAAGCGSEKVAGDDDGDALAERARQVADQWAYERRDFPSMAPRSPVKPAHDLPGYPHNRLLQVSADGRSVTVVALHGVCDDGPTVDALETRGSVVLSASVTGRDGEHLCTKQGKLERVEVRLRKPLGDRVLLDAHSGRPVPYRGTHGLSP